VSNIPCVALFFLTHLLCATPDAYITKVVSCTMSVLSDAEIIAKNPIGNGLDAFRRLFGAKCSISEVRELAETSDIGRSKQPLANSTNMCRR
jgi:hypothetical protein